MAQFCKYFGTLSLPTGFSSEHFQLFLALHDIGKPLRTKSVSQHEHTKEIVLSLASALPFSSDEWPVVLALLSDDPLGRYFTSVVTKPPSAERRNLAVALEEDRLAASDFRDYLNGVRQCVDDAQMHELARRAVCEIHSAASRAQVDSRSYLELLTIYHQVDLAGYSFDAGGCPGLDFALAMRLPQEEGVLRRGELPDCLFLKHGSGKRLLYNPQACEPAYQRLEACLENR